MQCKKCSSEFTPTLGLRNYCSLACRNSRDFSEASKNLKSTKNTEYFRDLPEEDKALIYSKLDKIRVKRVTNLEYLMSKPFSELSWDSKRTLVILEQNLACNKCGISSWLAQPITLEIDHIDGDKTNNARENLEGLCPNCHSQTPTWRGKHPRNKSKRQESLRRLQEAYVIN